MDINIDLTITGVPSAETAQGICNSIRRVLLDEHGTDIWVTYEEV